MDVYEEALVNVLMPEGAPVSWQESEEFSPYIQRLASCGLNKLSSECENLKEEEAAVLEQTKELAYKEYLTFIHAADCSKSMVTQLGALEQQLSRTSDSVSGLHDTLAKFVSSSRALLTSRHLNTTTLAKHTQLLEILELSQLLDTCVRNNYHDEALEIIAYVRRLEKKHGHIPIVKSIVREVQASSQQMLSQLLAQLRTDTSLPLCLKIVGLIRTLDVFTECQLRIKFLHARDAWLTAALRGIPHHDPYQHLSKSMECARVHVFDIVTQYRSIFSDDETRFSALHDHDTSLHAILQSWILHKVSRLLSMLRRELLKGGIAGSNLESLLAQCTFFGQSLSRIGADFRPLLPDIFQEAATRQLERDIRTANHKFDESLSAFSLLDAFPVMTAPPQLHTQGSSSRPPLALLEFPPLGHYVNSLVVAFNTLRLCCFTALLPTLLSLLTASLSKVVRSLVELQQVECAGFSTAETASFSRLCSVVCDVLLPYLNTVIRALYPLQHLAGITGTTVLQLSKANFGQLNIAVIVKPLQEFLPSQPTTADDLLSEVLDDLLSPSTEDNIAPSTGDRPQPEGDLSTQVVHSTSNEQTSEQTVKQQLDEQHPDGAAEQQTSLETRTAELAAAVMDIDLNSSTTDSKDPTVTGHDIVHSSTTTTTRQSPVTEKESAPDITSTDSPIPVPNSNLAVTSSIETGASSSVAQEHVATVNNLISEAIAPTAGVSSESVTGVKDENNTTSTFH
uniref:Conserved oligomeric Golgi complex subunit 8 n=2 Tax=Hirondellea gigas TaxID=1518452 RepID=A0A2P2I3N7_9CRUS